MVFLFLFFFLVAVGTIVERFGETAVVSGIHDHAAYLGGFFPAGIAFHVTDYNILTAGAAKKYSKTVRHIFEFTERIRDGWNSERTSYCA